MSFWIDRGGFDRIDANLQKEVYLTCCSMSVVSVAYFIVFVVVLVLI